MQSIEQYLVGLWPKSTWPRVQELLSEWQRSLDSRDSYSGSHVALAARHAHALASRLHLPPEATAALWLAGHVYDLGKIAVPQHVLSKRGPLSPAEMIMMRGHVSTGYEILKDWDLFRAAPRWLMQTVLDVVRYHHEHWDGGGYLEGLHDEQIPLAARVMAIADAYAAMIMERPFSRPMSPEDALRELQANAGSQFDPYLVRQFVSAVRITQLKDGHHDKLPPFQRRLAA